MRIIESLKFAQIFDETLDHVTDDTVEVLNKYDSTKDEIKIDYDSLEEGQEPIGDDNFDEFLVDTNLEEDEKMEFTPTEEFPMDEVPIEEAPTVVEPIKEVPTEEEAQEQETPEVEESVPDPQDDAKKHFGSDIRGALEWAKEQKRVVQIFYNTEGRSRGRGGKRYLKRELNLPKIESGGVNINRIIEPHYFFHADTTKRDILVTYDRSVRHVRAFVVDNITDYNFTKKRGTDEDQYFGRTNRRGIKIPIDTKPIKRIDKMENINDSLTEVGAELKAKGLIKSASVVKSAEEVLKSFKTAQYVGVQGYWLRNRRCWDNCYRQKRTTQPETSAQEVWMQCWDEYTEAINNPKSGWEKYAKRNKDVKISSKKEAQLNKKFASQVSKKVKAGMSTPEAVYTIIEKESSIQKDKILESSAQLMELADILSSSGDKDLGEKLANISAGMLKEAGIGDFVKGLGRGISDLWRGKDPEKENLQTVMDKLQQIQLAAENVLRTINREYSFSQSKNIVIEAKKGTKVVEAQSTINPQQQARQKAVREEEEKQELSKARYEDSVNPELAGGRTPSEQVGAPPVDDGPNGKPDGQEDKNKNNIADGQEDNNKNNIPDWEEDNNKNNIPDGQEDNTGADENADVPGDGVDSDQGGTDGPDDKQQANEALFKNFRRVYNGVKQHMRELVPMVSKLEQNSPAAQYLNAALNNFQSFVGEVDNHYNQQTLNNQTISPLLQNLIKATMDAQRGLSTGDMDVTNAPVGTPVAPAGIDSTPAGTFNTPISDNSGNIQFPQTQSNPLDQIDQMDIDNLKPIKMRVDKRWEQLQLEQKTQPGKPNTAVAYNHKLKIKK